MSDGWLPPRSPTPPPVPDSPERPVFAPPTAQPAPPYAAAPPQGPPPVGPGGGGGLPNRSAVVAFVCGIVAIGLTLISLGLMFIVTLPMGIAGWVVGNRALKAARSGSAGREGLARAARIIGIVATVLGAVALVTWMTLMAIDDTIVEDLERELKEFEDEQRDRSQSGDPQLARLGTVAVARLGVLLAG